MSIRAIVNDQQIYNQYLPSNYRRIKCLKFAFNMLIYLMTSKHNKIFFFTKHLKVFSMFEEIKGKFWLMKLLHKFFNNFIYLNVDRAKKEETKQYFRTQNIDPVYSKSRIMEEKYGPLLPYVVMLRLFGFWPMINTHNRGLTLLSMLYTLLVSLLGLTCMAVFIYEMPFYNYSVYDLMISVAFYVCCDLALPGE